MRLARRRGAGGMWNFCFFVTVIFYVNSNGFFLVVIPRWFIRASVWIRVIGYAYRFVNFVVEILPFVQIFAIYIPPCHCVMFMFWVVAMGWYSIKV